MRATALIEPGPVDRLLTVARATPADWSTTKADPHNEWTNRRGPVTIDNYDLAGTNTSAGGGYELGSPWMRACAGLDFYPHGSYKVYVSGGRLWAVCSMHQASLLHWFKQHWGDIVQAGAACVGLGAWGAEWGTATFIPGMTAVGAVGGCLVGGGASILHGDLPDQPPWKK